MSALISSRLIRQMTLAFLAAAAFQTAVASAQPAPVPGRNVNLVSGPAELNLAESPPIIRGDVLLKQQNEGSCAMSSRNPKNILCGGNDYRLVDLPGIDPDSVTRDAWGGVYQSASGGDTWESTVHPGHFLDPAPSVLKNYRAMADITVRSGAAGLAYYSGIAFNAANNSSIIFVSTWLDLNNKEDERMPFKMVRPVLVIDSGPVHQFMDKPWTFVSAPENNATCQIDVARPDGTVVTQTIPDSPLYIGYSIFVGNQPNQDQIRTKEMVVKVTNCGTTATKPVKVSEAQAINQGFAIAKSLGPGSNRLVGVWRRFDNGHETDAILAAVSDNGGATWSKPMVVAVPICPIEQGSTATSLRINTFPAIAADEAGRFYVAWSDRGKDATGACKVGGPSRIVIASSTNGASWTTPSIVDPAINNAHQITPSLTYGGGTLHLLWKDLRESASGYFDGYVNERPLLLAAAGSPPPPPPPPPVPPVRHHTVDVWSKMATINGPDGPDWGPSVRVSQYKFGVSPGEAEPSQKQWNIINLRLFAKGKKVFDGDYLDSTTPPLLPPDPHAGRSGWTYDTGQGGDPVFFGVWTDNRDVRRHPAHADVTGTVALPYTPPGGGGTSIADPTQARPVCVPGMADYTGTMNQNLYGARIDRGLFAYSPGNNKPITDDFPRAFVVIVRNDSDQPKTFELSIPAAYQHPLGGTASFTEVPPFSSELLVQVPRRSSAARSVFIVPDDDSATTLDPKTTVRVDVTEVGLDATLDTSVYINPDPTAPEIEAPEIEAPEIEATEVYTPEIEAALVRNIAAPEIEAPEIEAPEIEAPEIEAPEIEANSFQSPEIEAPEIEAPEIEAPEIEAPEIEANAITDVTWPVQNVGNTVAGYAVRPLVTGSLSGFSFQLIISRVVLIPTASNCQPAYATTSKVAVNIVDADDLVNPNVPISPEDLEHATIWIAPGERVLVTLRVRGDTAFDPAAHPTVLTAQQQAIDTEDLENGVTTPPIVTAGSVPVAVATNVLPAAQVGVPYSATLTATGGVAPYSWSATLGTLPPGLTLDSSGLIFGNPTAAGSYPFTVQVEDSGSSVQPATASFTIVVANPLSIATDSVPGGIVGMIYGQVVVNATGGVPPYTWTLDSGALPAGLSLNSSTGAIAGVPTAAGANSFVVKVTDSLGSFATKSLSIKTMAIGAGDYIVADGTSPGSIFRITPDGVTTELIATVPGRPIATAGERSGSFVVADPIGNSVLRVTPGHVEMVFSGAPLVNPVGIGVNAAGEIIIGDNNTDKVYKLAPNGSSIAELASLPASSSELQDVEIALDPSGDLIVTDDGAMAVTLLRIAPDGTTSTILSTTAISRASGLAIDASGNFIIADFLLKKIFTVTPGGSIVGSLDVGTIGINMTGLAIDFDGHYIIPLNFANTIRHVTTGGTITTIASGSPLTYPDDLLVFKPAITFERFPDGSGACASCPVSTEFSSLGVTFSYVTVVPQIPPVTQVQLVGPGGSDRSFEGDNHSVTAPAISGGGFYGGTMTMSFAGSPKTVVFRLRGNDTIGNPFGVTAIDGTNASIPSGQIVPGNVFTYTGLGSYTSREETVVVTSPNGVASIDLNMIVGILFVDNVVIKP